MANRTVLYDQHVSAGAKIVDFAGWDMPIHYGSQIEEHHAVRRSAGMFDVSHMVVLDLLGPAARDLLRRLLTNDVAKLKQVGKALYSCMLNEQGGVLDDLITYYVADDHYRTVVNAATRDKDLAWIGHHAETYDVELEVRDDLAMIAVQGPEARGKVLAQLGPGEAEVAQALEPFFAAQVGERFMGRTGYTGEDGFEIILPNGQAPGLWQALSAAGVRPCGLGARDTLRLEAGMNLYGSDMDETVTPLESGLGWAVAWKPEERRFIGREALERQRAEGPRRKLVGLVLEDRGVIRPHQRVLVPGVGDGEVTSGSYAPTLGKAIGLARVPVATGERCEVEIRGKAVPARVVKPPFVRHGEPQV